MAHGYEDAEVTHDGAPIANKLIHRIEVSLDVGLPNMCTVTLNNKDRAFSAAISAGQVLWVKFGDVAVFNGQVVNRGGEFSVKGETTFDVVAFCRAHDMTRKKRTKTWVKQTDAQIAGSLAREYGMKLILADSRSDLRHDHIIQHDLTDYSFLLERAKRAHCEVISENGQLIFRPRDLSARGERLLLKLATTAAGVHGEPEDSPHQISMQTFKARVNSTAPMVECEVAAWNPRLHRQTRGNAKGDAALVYRLGARSGVSMAHRILPDAIAHYPEPCDSDQEAELYAKSLFNDAALGYLVAEVQCKGDPRLRPGNIVDVEVGDELFDGPYYVSTVRHVYQHRGNGRGGYRTHLGICRNAEGKDPYHGGDH